MNIAIHGHHVKASVLNCVKSRQHSVTVSRSTPVAVLLYIYLNKGNLSKKKFNNNILNKLKKEFLKLMILFESYLDLFS